jgi:O-antigen ligase
MPEATNPLRTENSVLKTLLFLYALAVLTTMAGMEMFGWLSFVVILGFAIANRKNPWFKSPVLELGDKCLLALLVIIIASALIAAPDSSDKVFIIGNSRFVLLFIALRLGLEALSFEQIEKGLKILAMAIILISLYAISQHFTGQDLIRGAKDPISKVYTDSGISYRSRGMWGHPVTFGHSMALSFTMCLGALAVLFRERRYLVIFGLASLLAGVSLVYSYTRGAWIAVAAAIFVMSLYLGRKVAIASIVGGALLIGGGALSSAKFRDRLVSIVSTTNQSNTERLDVWKANIAMFKENPVLGVGYGVNEEIIGDYYEKLGIQQEFGGHAHNNYLQFLSGTGLLGFLAYTAFSLIFLWMAHSLLRTLPADAKLARAITLGALGAQIALHVGGLTECNFKDAEVNHQYMLILALLTVVWRRYSHRSVLKTISPAV